MKKIVLSALCAVAFAACGGGGGGDDGGDVTLEADANPNSPDATSNQACNPVTQAGCEAGEKCAQLVESEEPFLARTACVPDGTITDGGACTRGEPGANGYDDCVAGFDCLNGVCTKICDIGPPDGCREEGEAFGEGDYCTLYADLFSDNIGLCVAGCDPLNDTVTDGAAVNADCGAGNGCYLNATRGIAACAGTPAPAAEVTQNEECYGPMAGSCFLNGCASGFTALLNNKPEDADGSVCARYCQASVTYKDAGGALVGDVEGVGGNCGLGSLGQVGGTAGTPGEHQCRFVQTFYSNTDQVPVEVGMCVPVSPVGGGTWGDCRLFEWDGIKTAWNDAVAAGTDPNEAFNSFCLVNPDDPMNSDIEDKCLGIFRGCLSLQEEDEGLDDPAGMPFVSRAAWAKSVGLKLPELLNVEQAESF